MEICDILDKTDVSLASREKIARLVPYSSIFCEVAIQYQNSASRRCLSKILLSFAEKHVAPPSAFQLEEKEVSEIINFSFDCLIQNYRTAEKVFATQRLLMLQGTSPWIKKELTVILLKEIPKETAGYPSRAMKILRKLRKLKE